MPCFLQSYNQQHRHSVIYLEIYVLLYAYIVHNATKHVAVNMYYLTQFAIVQP